MAARLRTTLALLIITFLAAVASAGPAVPSAATAGNAHAAVWAYAAAHPRQPVPVIVQATPGADPAQAVRAAGGSVRMELGIIRAVAADVPGDRLAALAGNRDVSWISLDAPAGASDRPDGASGKDDAGRRGRGGSDDPPSVFPQEISADAAWAAGDRGQGVAVAVVDTGIANSADFGSPRRIVATVTRDGSRRDGYGHGTAVAGLVAGNGAASDGTYTGVAPAADLVNVKVGDTRGAASLSDVINGLQWVLENKDRFNIRVVNLSLTSTVPQRYTTDPLDAAVELLTFRGILVVAAAGNDGTAAAAVDYAPANDPFVLTVGAVDDMGTVQTGDDAVAPWSSRGTTQDGFAKPDVYTPGRRLVSVLSPGSVLAQQSPANIVDGRYLRLSGTSMAAAVASGAAALVIQAHPDWTPAQVKAALVSGATPLASDASAPLVQVDRALAATPAADASQDIQPNELLLQAAGFTDPASITWGSITWGSITWGSIRWGSIRWGYVPE